MKESFKAKLTLSKGGILGYRKTVEFQFASEYNLDSLAARLKEAIKELDLKGVEMQE